MGKFVVFACAMMMACGSVWADKVILKSGSTLTGTMGAVTLDKMKFASDDLGDIEIPIAKISSVEAAGLSHVIQYLDNSTTSKKLTIVDGALASEENGAWQKLDLSNVKAINPSEETWHGSLNASATFTRGNTVGEAASVFGDVSRRWEHDRFTARAGYYYSASGDSKETKQKTESRFELEAQEDHFWSTRFYSYVNGKYEFDRIMLLDYRYRLGVGLGFQWFENRDFGYGKTSFNQELGATYMVEKYETLREDDYATARYAHHYTWEIAKVDGLFFAHNFELLPQVDDWQNNYLINADAGITYAFRANWQLIAKVEWAYRKKVPEDTKNSDIRYILGLGYKW